MVQSTTRLYEGLFLVSQAAAGSDYAGVVNHIKEVLARAEAEVVLLTKWDERRLAYDIQNGKRGTYFLSLFKARSTQIANIERDCNLSETIIRAMILRGDHIGDAELEEYLKAAPADQDSAMRDPNQEDEKVADTAATETAPASATDAATETATAAATDAATETAPAAEPAVVTEEAPVAPVTEETVAQAPVTEEAAEQTES